LINGLFSAYFRVPAVIITIITGALAYSVSLLVSQGSPIMGPFPTLEDMPSAAFLLIFLTLIIAFLLVLLTPLGQPKHKRERTARPVSYMFAYISSSVIAVFAGFFMMLRLGAAVPTLGTGYEINILFIFAVVYSSRALDNRIAPVLFSIIPAWILCVLTNVLSLMAYPFYVQSLINGALTLVFGILAFICRNEKQTEMLNLISN
jgi:ribose transport system permease protein